MITLSEYIFESIAPTIAKTRQELLKKMGLNSWTKGDYKNGIHPKLQWIDIESPEKLEKSKLRRSESGVNLMKKFYNDDYDKIIFFGSSYMGKGEFEKKFYSCLEKVDDIQGFSYQVIKPKDIKEFDDYTNLYDGNPNAILVSIPKDNDGEPELENTLSSEEKNLESKETSKRKKKADSAFYKAALAEIKEVCGIGKARAFAKVTLKFDEISSVSNKDFFDPDKLSWYVYSSKGISEVESKVVKFEDELKKKIKGLEITKSTKSYDKGYVISVPVENYEGKVEKKGDYNPGNPEGIKGFWCTGAGSMRDTHIGYGAITDDWMPNFSRIQQHIGETKFTRYYTKVQTKKFQSYDSMYKHIEKLWKESGASRYGDFSLASKEDVCNSAWDERYYIKSF